jgi:hypothetical protein
VDFNVCVCVIVNDWVSLRERDKKKEKEKAIE